MLVKDVIQKTYSIFSEDSRINSVLLLGKYDSLFSKVGKKILMVIDSHGQIMGLDICELEDRLEKALEKETQIFEYSEVQRDHKLLADARNGSVKIYERNRK